MTDPNPQPAMFAIEGREIVGGKPQVLWYRKLDDHWTHHNTRAQFYTQDEAMDIFDALPVTDRVVRVIPASEVPA